jgi:hypothetical protein
MASLSSSAVEAEHTNGLRCFQLLESAGEVGLRNNVNIA